MDESPHNFVRLGAGGIGKKSPAQFRRVDQNARLSGAVVVRKWKLHSRQPPPRGVFPLVQRQIKIVDMLGFWQVGAIEAGRRRHRSNNCRAEPVGQVAVRRAFGCFQIQGGGIFADQNADARRTFPRAGRRILWAPPFAVARLAPEDVGIAGMHVKIGRQWTGQPRNMRVFSRETAALRGFTFFCFGTRVFRHAPGSGWHESRVRGGGFNPAAAGRSDQSILVGPQSPAQFVPLILRRRLILHEGGPATVQEFVCLSEIGGIARPVSEGDSFLTPRE